MAHFVAYHFPHKGHDLSKKYLDNTILCFVMPLTDKYFSISMLLYLQ